MNSIVLNRRSLSATDCVLTNLVINEAGNEIEIYDTIVPYKWSPDDPSVTVQDVVGVLKNMKGDVVLRINSRGGEVGAALTIFNRIREYSGGKTTAVVDGYAFSSAGWIPLACDDRKICTGGIWMCHNPIMYPEVRSLSDLEKIKSQYEANYNSIVDIICGTTNISEDEVKNMMEKETFLSATEAVEKGIFNSIHEAKPDHTVLNYCPPANLPKNIELAKPDTHTTQNVSRLLLKRRMVKNTK